MTGDFRGKCTGAVRVHRRVTVAVPRLRDRRAAVEHRGVHRTVRTRRVAGQGRFFTVRAGSLVAWRADEADRAGPFRIVGAHTDSPNLRVKQHPDRFVVGLAGGCPAALRRGLAELVAGSRSRHQWPAVGTCRQHHRPPAGTHRRTDPARATAGDSPGRGPQVGLAGSAAARQRGLGRRQRPPVVSRLRRRACGRR